MAPEEPRRRADAEANLTAILDAASTLLRAEPEASLEEIAAAAGLSRTTIYRHFNTRSALVQAARLHAQAESDANEQDALRPAGELAGGPTPLDVADVLNKVPPHLLGEQIVAEAQRLAGVSSVALYLIDIDGTNLLRQAGSAEFPSKLRAPMAVGPEIPREGLKLLREEIESQLPGALVVPMLLRGRATGVLLAVDGPEGPLLELGRQAAAALALGDSYTDTYHSARRRRETSAASEIQQNLLPPRIARISGGMLAGNVLPGYDIGGDWFDYVENADGAWLGIADAPGSGTIAAAISAVALGAFRAARRVDSALDEAALTIHRTVQEIPLPEARINAVLCRWNGPMSTFHWITCGHQPPLLITTTGELEVLDEHQQDPLGIGDPRRGFQITHRQLQPGERLLLLSDGVLERKTTQGGTLGLAGVQQILASVTDGAAAPTVRALENGITGASADPLQDDATIVVFAPTTPEQ